MENKIDINGGWVVLRDPKQVPERLRRPLISMTAKTMKAFNVEQADENNISPEAIEFYSEFNDLLALALISSWSFGDVTNDILLDLPGETYDKIRELVAPLVSDLMPNFSPSPDPKAPTEA